MRSVSVGSSQVVKMGARREHHHHHRGDDLKTSLLLRRDDDEDDGERVGTTKGGDGNAVKFITVSRVGNMGWER